MKVAICDKDTQFIKTIKNLIEEMNINNEVPLVSLLYTNPFEMLAHYSNYRDFEILIINVDIENAFDVAKSLRRLDKKIRIILTAQKGKMAIKGYTVNASHYFLKPINIDRFRVILNELIGEIINENSRFILNRNKNRLDKIYYNEIKYIETCQRKTLINTIHGQYYSNITMKEHLSKLHQYGFEQVHSGYIINIEFIKNILSDMIVLRDGEKIVFCKHFFLKYAD